MQAKGIVKHALLGAGVGGGLASLLIVLTFESRFVVDALLVLGIGAMIGGALCGLIVSKYGTVGITIGGIVGGIGGCALAMIGTMIYAGLPWPSPQPYSGASVQMEGGAGSWGPSHVRTYTVAMPLNTIQQYYESQMKRYCENTWTFSTLSDSECYSCREASCKIRRLGLEQYFRVRLHPISETQTEVIQVDHWQD